jgi:hypothetical protein
MGGAAVSMSADLWTVAEAIRQLPSVCLYHGADFGKSGYMGPRDGGRPRCDSCLPAWRRMCGMAALQRVQDTIGPPSGVLVRCPSCGDDVRPGRFDSYGQHPRTGQAELCPGKGPREP